MAGIFDNPDMQVAPSKNPFDAPDMKVAGKQPSVWDRVVSSPIGRFVQTNVVAPAMGINSAAMSGLDFGMGLIPNAYQGMQQAETQGYEGALARNRNTPGYTNARAQAEKLQQRKGSGITEQATSNLNPTLAGIFALPGGLDASNAAADAQQAAQDAYAWRHPVLSTAAGLVGGLAQGGMPAPQNASGSILHNAVTTPAPTAQEQAAARVRAMMSQSKTAPDEAALRATHAAAGGKPITSAEAIGSPAEVDVGALARREGATADALNAAMTQRQAFAPSRMMDDFTLASGIDPRLAQGDIESYVKAGRETVSPMFKQALGEGANSPAIWNSDLEALSQRPVVQKAMDAVANDLANAGKDATAFGFTSRDPASGKFVQQPRPTAEAWDMIRKRVGSLAERDAFGRILPDSLSPGNYNINVAGRDLTDVLAGNAEKNIAPAIQGYRDALDASGDYLSLQRAFEDGGKFILNPKVSSQEVKKYIANLTPPEQEAFKGGIANQIFVKSQNGRLAPNLFYTGRNFGFNPIPNVQEKLAAALGPQGADTFLKGLQQEGKMAGFARTRVPGAGSPTAAYTDAMASQDAAFHNPLVEAGQRLVASGGSPKRAVGQYLTEKLGDLAATYQSRGMPVPVRNAAGEMYIMSPGDLANLLENLGNRPGVTAPVLGTKPAPLGIPLGVLPQMLQLQNR